MMPYEQDFMAKWRLEQERRQRERRRRTRAIALLYGAFGLAGLAGLAAFLLAASVGLPLTIVIAVALGALLSSLA
jgi:fatty acid desaturase